MRRTPVLQLAAGSFGFDFDLALKLETCQHTGSYKPRGVFNRLLARGDVNGSRTVVAASGGNHGIAVAHAASTLGFAAQVFVPTLTPPEKLRQIRELGGEVMVSGANYGEALAASERHARETGALSIHAFDEPELIEGQGTVALELDQQAGAPDTVLVAAGGGSLLAGVCAWYAGTATRVIGVEPVTARAVGAALEAGEPVDVTVGGVAADSLGARARRPPYLQGDRAARGAHADGRGCRDRRRAARPLARAAAGGRAGRRDRLRRAAVGTLRAGARRARRRDRLRREHRSRQGSRRTRRGTALISLPTQTFAGHPPQAKT